MKIVNYSKEFTDKQLFDFVNILGKDYTPRKIVIYGDRLNALRYSFVCPLFGMVLILLGRIEGIYSKLTDVVHIFVFAQNDDGDNLQSKQLYSLHALTHELRHKYQRDNKIKLAIEKDADEFATTFLNNNTKKIKDIMGWKDEWTISE